MSEREFELYLSVLGGMMKLSSAQRKDLAEELRSHMDERLDELIAEGLTRDEAIQTALEEFGDAAGLADNFTQIAQLKQRRRIMRWTTGTIAATTCAILALASFWPQNNPAAPLIVSTIEAQSEAGDIDPGASGGGSIDLSVPQNAIEAKLSRPFPDQINFIDISLSDALNLISQVIEVDILIDGNVSEQLDQGQTVNLVLQYGNVTTKTLIALLFEQAGIDEEFSYIVRDEILYITE
ncbi:MAG TPA: permease prefix domain 1-containing protein, partial [Planctomycetaceae bacterium]|nr:permease prefix domain 1-containing protein [Planctomycetaceae bacterium]